MLLGSHFLIEKALKRFFFLKIDQSKSVFFFAGARSCCLLANALHSMQFKF